MPEYEYDGLLPTSPEIDAYELRQKELSKSEDWRLKACQHFRDYERTGLQVHRTRAFGAWALAIEQERIDREIAALNAIAYISEEASTFS